MKYWCLLAVLTALVAVVTVCAEPTLVKVVDQLNSTVSHLVEVKVLNGRAKRLNASWWIIESGDKEVVVSVVYMNETVYQGSLKTGKTYVVRASITEMKIVSGDESLTIVVTHLASGKAWSLFGKKTYRIYPVPCGTYKVTVRGSRKVEKTVYFTGGEISLEKIAEAPKLSLLAPLLAAAAVPAAGYSAYTVAKKKRRRPSKKAEKKPCRKLLGEKPKRKEKKSEKRKTAVKRREKEKKTREKRRLFRRDKKPRDKKKRKVECLADALLRCAPALIVAVLLLTAVFAPASPFQPSYATEVAWKVVEHSRVYTVFKPYEKTVKLWCTKALDWKVADYKKTILVYYNILYNKVLHNDLEEAAKYCGILLGLLLKAKGYTEASGKTLAALADTLDWSAVKIRDLSPEDLVSEYLLKNTEGSEGFLELYVSTALSLLDKLPVNSFVRIMYTPFVRELYLASLVSIAAASAYFIYKRAKIEGAEVEAEAPP